MARSTAETTYEWWLPALEGRTGPLYQGIATAIADAVRDGDLLAGDRLPPHRLLARLLSIDVTTATRAYAEAQRQGLIESHVGRGTFIRAEAPLLQSRRRHGPVVDLSMNLPPVPEDPSLRTILREGLDRVLRRQDLAAMMTYHWDTGSAEDRTAGAAWLRPCLDRIDPQRILVCPGAQSGMLAVVSSLTRPGDVVLTESVTYPGIRALAAQFDVTLAGVPIDDEGFVPDELDRMCRELRPRLIYCNPTIQNPTTATMSLARRRDIVAVARVYGTPILEDDAYGLLPSDPYPALASFAPELVFYLATTAKALTPGLRVAYLVSPSTTERERFTAAVRGSVQMGSGLLTGLATTLIRSGDAGLLLDAIRKEATTRQSIAAAALSRYDIVAHPEGLHVWLRLPSIWRAADFVDVVRHHGLALVADDVFRVGRETANAVRLALGAASSRAQLETAVSALATAIEGKLPECRGQIV